MRSFLLTKKDIEVMNEQPLESIKSAVIDTCSNKGQRSVPFKLVSEYCEKSESGVHKMSKRETTKKVKNIQEYISLLITIYMYTGIHA